MMPAALATARRAESEGSGPVEMVVGLALIVIAALEIWFIIRTVQSNLGRA
jgi:hypothetical protein